MAHLDRLWVGMLTRNNNNAGTNSRIALIINETGNAFGDNLHHTFQDSPQDDQEQGEANLYELGSSIVRGAGIEPDNLDNASIRIGIRGDDMWRPRNIFVWGRRLRDQRIFPLCIETAISTRLSTDTGEGNLSLPLRLVDVGGPEMTINRLLVVLTTANVKHAGTNDDVELQVTAAGGGLVADFTIPGGSTSDTPQDDLQRAQANWHFIPVLGAFSRNTTSTVRLTIAGKNAWLPGSFFLFGLDDASGRPNSIVPLVAVEDWNLGWLSRDPSEGATFANLPLEPA